MKRHIRFLFLFVLISLFISANKSSLGEITRLSAIDRSDISQSNIEHVILIIIDGARPSVLLEVNTTEIDALASEGSYTWKAWTTKPSNTISAVPSIVTGANPTTHRVGTWDGQIYAETMIEVFEEAGLPCAIINQDPIVGGYRANYSTGYDGSPGSDDRSMTEAIDVFVNRRPYFMMIYNPIPDQMLEYSHESEEYRKSLENASYQIGRLTEKLKELEVYNRTLIVITTDHGATGYSHSTQFETDMTIFSIWKGPGVRIGYEMENHLYIFPTSTHDETIVAHRITDIAPTIMELVGLRAPENNEGNTILQIKESHEAVFAPSSITCSTPSSNVTFGLNITLSGLITPARSGIKVTLIYKRSGSWNTLATVDSTSDGGYAYTWTPKSTGRTQLEASWEGDDSYIGAASNTLSLMVTVQKKPTTISCLTKSEIFEGEVISVSGTISPVLSGRTVILTYTRPDGSFLNREVTTNSDGEYVDSFQPDQIGSWNIVASWEGDSTHEGASSSQETFALKEKSGCLIATATYGSELSPQVQFLRDFRDNIVLDTFAGSQFMNVFNKFYYSFSPTIASKLRENPTARDISKIILYPLMGILHLSSSTFNIFSQVPEIGVIITGLSASSLIGTIYLTPIVLIARKSRKFKKYASIAIKTFSAILLLSIGLIIIAEIISSSIVMMIATGTLILTTISLSTLTITSKLSNILIHLRKINHSIHSFFARIRA